MNFASVFGAVFGFVFGIGLAVIALGAVVVLFVIGAMWFVDRISTPNTATARRINEFFAENETRYTHTAQGFIDQVKRPPNAGTQP